MLPNFQRLTRMTDVDAICGASLGTFEPESVHIHCKDLDGKYISSNDQVWRDAGLNGREELCKRTDFDMAFLEPSEAASFRKIDKLIISSGKTQFFCQTLTLANGKKYTALNHKTPLFSKSKQIVGVTSFGVVIEQYKTSFYDPCYPVLNFLFASKIELAHLLSKRQMACLYYLVAGLSIKGIAIKLKLSERTVEHYIDAIKLKLNCPSRASLISFVFTM